MIKLIAADTNESFEFGDDVEQLTLGRVDGNDVVVDNPDVSALHGQIILQQGSYRFQDLNSTNGSAILRGDQKTRLEGESREEFVLQEGDRILLGGEDEPAELLVEVCRGSEEPTQEASVVTRHPLKTVREMSEKLEKGGASLVPYLALADRLSSASTAEEAEIEFHDCIREVIPSIRDITLVDAPQDPPAVLEISVLEVEGGQGQIARIPVDLSPTTNRLALLKSGEAGFSPADLNAGALAATLLAARLRHLRQEKS